jgi:hypothetical protein
MGLVRMGRLSLIQQRRRWNGWTFTVLRIRAVPRPRVGRGCSFAVIFGSRSLVQAWKKESLASAQRSKRRFVLLMPNISLVYAYQLRHTVAGSIIQG